MQWSADAAWNSEVKGDLNEYLLLLYPLASFPHVVTEILYHPGILGLKTPPVYQGIQVNETDD